PRWRVAGVVMRKAAITCGVVGLVLLIGAALMAFWITPSYIARLPSSYNKTRTYAGTLSTLINPAALSTGNLSAAIMTNVPQTVRDQVQVTQTSGNTALARDTETVTAAGTQILRLSGNYAVDRSSLAATSSHPGNWSVVPAKGQIFSFPIPAKKQNYTVWEPLTETSVAATYVAQVQHGGITTYQYKSVLPVRPVKNTQALTALPKALPTSLLSKISAAGIIPSADVAALGKAFPGATAIPLAYTYQATSTYWVAPDTGIVVDVSTTDTEEGAIALPTGKTIPLLPVLAGSYKATSSSLQAAVKDANNGSSTISTWGMWVPIAAAVVGFVLLVIAVILWLRGRSAGHTAQHGRPEPRPSPGGQIR
ncbi:MAG TPA: porin PorA family protein, partial [Streptosporangiaceae bacterium]|nr:porin PorA family protein [Streptosporangiaceae bacterium]